MSAELYLDPTTTSSNRTRMFVKFIAFISLIFALLLISHQISSSAYPEIEKNLVLQRVDGVQQQLNDFIGKPLVVTFWSPSCAPCMHEIASFNELYQHHQGGKDFELLALSMYYDRPDWVLQTRQQQGMLYPVYLDLQKQLSRAFGDIVATPTTFLLDATGQVIYQHTGRVDFAYLSQKLSELTG